MHERDLFSFFFLADRYWHKSFLEDIRSGDDSANVTGLGGDPPGRGVLREQGEFQEQGMLGTVTGAGHWQGGGLAAPVTSNVFFKEAVKRRGRRNPPPAGAAMKTCVKDILPEVASLLAVIER